MIEAAQNGENGGGKAGRLRDACLEVLVEHGREVLSGEHGGATIDRRTFREMPAAFRQHHF